MAEPDTSPGISDLPGTRYSSRDLDRLVSTLKDRPRETPTLVMLAGPTADQKTVTAEAIAKQLQRSLFRVDLGDVVSKYIGETEKNIDRVFTDAARSGAVLLLEEADALFGERTDVEPAGDRYGSVEVTYLLQRVDAYSGVVLMIVNDPEPARDAVKRRLRRATTLVVLDR